MPNFLSTIIFLGWCVIAFFFATRVIAPLCFRGEIDHTDQSRLNYRRVVDQYRELLTGELSSTFTEFEHVFIGRADMPTERENMMVHLTFEQDIATVATDVAPDVHEPNTSVRQLNRANLRMRALPFSTSTPPSSNRWDHLPDEIRRRARDIIVNYYTPEVLAEVCALHQASPDWARPYFNDWGAGCRILLRTGHMPSKDTLLPGIDDSELPTGSWDHYYAQCVEYAAGVEGLECRTLMRMLSTR